MIWYFKFIFLNNFLRLSIGEIFFSLFLTNFLFKSSLIVISEFLHSHIKSGLIPIAEYLPF